jgi:hypothetical protein
MKFLLIASLAFNLSGTCPKQDLPSLRISVVSQRVFRNRGHHPENNRRVVFRMVNESRKPVIIYGFRYQGGFDPTGYLIALDKSTGEWAYPTGDNCPIGWNEESREFKSTYVLLPGKSLNFDAEMSVLETGEQFKRTVYASFSRNDEPCEVQSEEFALK